ncbi:DUF6988 family protein [Burkholderia contaminans]|uniref:DUF6988 family protein n=1 Tax=Burkholderia contaminans TaxID=488447 RepID=UPI0015E46E8F|nr:hypothetical protein [Burkholderia contaminans]
MKENDARNDANYGRPTVSALDGCANLVDGVEFKTTLRARVVVALHHLCIERHLAGHVLVDSDVRGSAFALYRPQFEAYVRANWYLECASEGDLEKFVEGEEPPRMPQLTADLAVALGQAGEIIGSVKAQAWRSMCAFTHGGAVQVKARAIKDEIRQSFTDEHTSKLIDSMAMLSYLGALGIA